MVAMVISFSITAVVVSIVWHNIISYIKFYTLGTCVLSKCVGTLWYYTKYLIPRGCLIVFIIIIGLVQTQAW